MQPFIEPKKILDRRLTKTGIPGGDSNANEDYSSGGLDITKFFSAPLNEETYEIYSFGMTMTTPTAFESGDYGDGLVLANGVKITIEDDVGTVLHDFLGGGTIINNFGWGIILNIDPIIERSNSPAGLTGSDTFIATNGAPIRIVGSRKERFVVTLNDDMTSRLSSQGFAISGQNI